MLKKILIAVGGTGGHIYPAISLGKQLMQENESVEVRYVGGFLSANRYFDFSLPYNSVSCGSFVSKNPIKLLANLIRICKGIYQSRQIIKQVKPDIIVGFGSYYTLPILTAAKLSSVPIILHEANSIPGKVNRFFSKYAVITGIHFPSTQLLIKGKSEEVGMPLREEFSSLKCSKQKALEYFGLSQEKPILLIFGGSQGAQGINRLFTKDFAHIISTFPLQVIHLTGNSQSTLTIRQIYEEKGIKAVVKDFETCMHLAWKAADLVVSRSGAGTLAELLEFEVPGILIPYPLSADQHQDKNADFMVEIVKGAIKLHEGVLNSSILGKKIHSFFIPGDIKLQQMRESMRIYKQKSRTKNLCGLIKEYLEVDHSC